MPIVSVPSAFSNAEMACKELRNQERSDFFGAASELNTDHLTSTDERIVRQLERLSEGDSDYWTFRRGAARRQAHRLTQYPAMMVPPMQAVLLDVVAKVDGQVCTVLDPFAGSGTTLVECMRLGLNYAGQDINPLALLFCRTKAGPFHTTRLASAVKDIVERASSDRGTRVEADFPGLEKWFSFKAANELSRIPSTRPIRRRGPRLVSSSPVDWPRRDGTTDEQFTHFYVQATHSQS